jgi:dsRNA-specific ribonuclease
METIEEFARDLLKTDSEGALALALTPKYLGEPNNERLEFLGNTILNMRLAEAVYDMDPMLTPGTMSQMCNYLRSDQVLVMVGKDGGLAITLAKRLFDKGCKVTDKMNIHRVRGDRRGTIREWRIRGGLWVHRQVPARR